MQAARSRSRKQNSLSTAGTVAQSGALLCVCRCVCVSTTGNVAQSGALRLGHCPAHCGMPEL